MPLIYGGWLIKIPLSANGHSSQITTLLSRIFREPQRLSFAGISCSSLLLNLSRKETLTFCERSQVGTLAARLMDNLYMDL